MRRRAIVSTSAFLRYLVETPFLWTPFKPHGCQLLRVQGFGDIASLAEDNHEKETPETVCAAPWISPLSDRCMNINSPLESISANGIKLSSFLHAPKSQDSPPDSPNKCVLLTPRLLGTKPGWGRPNIRRMRGERARRRSSLIPPLPQDANTSISIVPKRLVE